MRAGKLALGLLIATALGVAVAQADLAPAGGPVSVVSNFGRLITPRGELTQLGYFPAGAALTPDGRFLWTVDAGRKANGVQILDTARGNVVQELISGQVGIQGGIVISRDGRRAYVSEPRAPTPDGQHQVDDRIAVYGIDAATGHATPAGDIAVPAPGGGVPVDDFPPNPNEFKSFPAGLALSPDGRTLVAALDLSDRVAVIDTATRAVNQVQVRSDTKPGDRAYPLAVTVGGGRAFVADEGDGTVASFDLANPSQVTRATPSYSDPQGINPKRTHPTAILASADGKRLFVALAASDQILELDPADPSRVLMRIDDRRGPAVGTQPVGLGLTPDGDTLLVANAGEDVVRAIALTERGVLVPRGEHLPGALDAAARPGGASHPAYGGPLRGGSPAAGARPSPRGRSCLRRRAARRRPRARGHRRLRARRRRPAASPARRRAYRRRSTHRRSRVRGRRRSLPCSMARRHRPAPPRHRRRRARRSSAAPGTALLLHPGDEIARVPAAIYPRSVLVSPDARQLLVVDAKGVGPGSTLAAGESVSDHVLGVLQRIPLPAGQGPRDTQLIRLGHDGDQVALPVDHVERAPAGSPLVGADGSGPSQKIKYVFYVVTENKTYDSVLGDLGRGNGDPCLAIFGEYRTARTHADGSPCPQDRFGTRDSDVARFPGMSRDGTPVTPNEHRLARDFVTLDNTHANSETSDDGHIWTSSAYAPDHDLRATLSNNGPGGYPFDLVYPVSAPPRGFFFDSLVRQGVSFFNYGEAAAGLAFPDSQATSEEQQTRSRVLANSEFITQYPSSAAIDNDPITHRDTLDHDPGPPVDPTKRVSRMQYFRQRFQAQLAACPAPSSPSTCAVPQYQELLFPNNHTNGTKVGRRTPDALVRDTDQAIGQLVSDISHSPIWPYSAVFVVQDDAQSGADHVDGHRITALVASPYARRGAVVSTHYDQVSIIRTIELILGMKPAYMYDALARPMWEAFQATPQDTKPWTPYSIPEALMEEQNPSGSPMARLSSRISWVADTVPEHLLNRIQWAYRYGTPAACPARTGPLGTDHPCASDLRALAAEQAKAPAQVAALRRALRSQRRR